MRGAAADSRRAPAAASPQNSSIRWVLPFAALIALLAIQSRLPAAHSYTIRTLVVFAVLIAVSGPVIALRPRFALRSVAVGVSVFVLWVAPDTLFPGWRGHWLFSNGLLGSPATGTPRYADALWIAFRVAGSALLVPVVEELFWRGWLMRWLIDSPFWKVPLGTYAPRAFWITAILFASEHGPYWEVGLAAGVVYNWWMVRTTSLADCILAHAVTNGCLAAYVLLSGKWQYWL